MLNNRFLFVLKSCLMPVVFILLIALVVSIGFIKNLYFVNINSYANIDFSFNRLNLTRVNDVGAQLLDVKDAKEFNSLVLQICDEAKFLISYNNGLSRLIFSQGLKKRLNYQEVLFLKTELKKKIRQIYAHKYATSAHIRDTSIAFILLEKNSLTKMTYLLKVLNDKRVEKNDLIFLTSNINFNEFSVDAKTILANNVKNSINPTIIKSIDVKQNNKISKNQKKDRELATVRDAKKEVK